MFDSTRWFHKDFHCMKWAEESSGGGGGGCQEEEEAGGERGGRGWGGCQEVSALSLSLSLGRHLTFSAICQEVTSNLPGHGTPICSCYQEKEVYLWKIARGHVRVVYPDFLCRNTNLAYLNTRIYNCKSGKIKTIYTVAASFGRLSWVFTEHCSVFSLTELFYEWKATLFTHSLSLSWS